ncbi:MAG: hypothetical protein EON60_05570 [Alphaproteobacteria bacterium]|nr:MAG: hypothetical protein EON60_05570 [Alphaproteobacteria bacterium]
MATFLFSAFVGVLFFVITGLFLAFVNEPNFLQQISSAVWNGQEVLSTLKLLAIIGFCCGIIGSLIAAFPSKDKA